VIALLIARREINQALKTWSGYIIGASLLLLSGLLYNVLGVGAVPQYSRDVLANAYYFLSGTSLVAGILFAMRLVAEERQTGSLPLLSSSPISDGQLVAGKFLGGFTSVAIYVACTLYIPLLVWIRGNVTVGHIVAGHFGLLLIGAAGVSIGLLGSVLFRSQLLAAIVSGVIAVVMLVLWPAKRLIDGPLGDVIGAMALHDRHFRPFMDGTISFANVVYYGSVIAFFLVLSRNVMEAKRWRG
jgi:ABC-2 type transport system permease protein